MPSIKEVIKVKPYDHQRRAVEFALNLFGITPLKGQTFFSNGVAMLIEMGCGKTLISIIIASILHKLGKINKVLVVSPLSITGVWVSEFAKYCNIPYEATVLKGSLQNKKKQLYEINKKIELGETNALQVMIINYESAWRLEREFYVVDPDMVIADEGHKIKDFKSAQSKGLHALGRHAKYKLLLTGTIVTNHEIDVFSPYLFLNPSIYGDSFYRWRTYYFNMTGYGFHIPEIKKSLLDDFLKRMHSIAFRVTKAECLDLPETTDKIVSVELEPEAMKTYKELENDLYTKFDDGEEVTTSNILTKVLRLSQLTGGYLTTDESAVVNISKKKLEALEDIIDTAMYEDKKLVVIARFNAELDAIETLLKNKKINYACIRGAVKDRSLQVEKFQEDNTCKVFLGQIATAGLGITLTAASTMVFYSLDYSMSNHDQCKARIHRSGQTHNCEYIYLIAKNTIDRKVLKALKDKTDLAKTLVDDYRNGIKTTDDSAVVNEVVGKNV